MTMLTIAISATILLGTDIAKRNSTMCASFATMRMVAMDKSFTTKGYRKSGKFRIFRIYRN